MLALGPLEVPSYIYYSIVIVILSFLYYKNKLSYWKNQGVPGPIPLPIIGTIMMFSGTPLHILQQKLYRKYGRNYGLVEADRNTLFITEPEEIKKILVKDFDKFNIHRTIYDTGNAIVDNFLITLNGDAWHSMRNVVTPSFSSSKLRKISKLIVECCNDLCLHLDKVTADDKEVDMKSLYGSYTLNVIAITAFGTKINSIDNQKSKFVENAKKMFEFRFSLKLLCILFIPSLAKLLKLSFFDVSASTFFYKIIQEISRQRENEKERTVDFLSVIKESIEKNNKDIDTRNSCSSTKKQGEATKIPITEDMFVSNCVLFFFAGYDTISTTLSMTSYHLSMNPEIQDILIEEIDKTIEKYGTLDYDSISEMSYLDACVKETLRLNAPFYQVEREATEDYMLGNVYLKKGTGVVIPIYSLHRDAKYWPDPEKYNPERFCSDKFEITPYTYLPFGIGRRDCAAKRFAILEVKLALASVLRKFKFAKSIKSEIPPKMKSFIVVQPENVFLKIVRRN